MTLAQRILVLWAQGLDTYEIAQRLGMAEAVVYRELIYERTSRRADARQAGRPT